MESREIRQQFLEFFREREHAVVESASVVPHDDPTLLFTNAGMNQFKDVFLGSGTRPYVRAVDTQKCIRAGGKHNDLDDVGQDTYHHTFFEMLGNWSFGDYFKRDAITWAWELLTEVWGVEKDRLYATYFEGDATEDLAPDDEAKRLWSELTDIPKDNIVPGDKKDNFWEMGDTGPCGPCSEIHIDLTPDKSGGDRVNADDPLVIEIWNLVFIQFNRGTDGKLSPLPAQHVDTGMGFERLCAVLQKKTSNYDTDVFTPIFAAIRERTGAIAYTGKLPQSGSADTQDAQLMVDISYRVVADHLRTLTFALTDGATISNEGRGYVLRRVLRRAVRYGRQYLGVNEPFLVDLVDGLVDSMKEAFPELLSARGGKNVAHVKAVLREEEESFGRTLDRGIRLFGEAAERAIAAGEKTVSGADAFKLHDTYGFPIDLTVLMAEEQGFRVDTGDYERRMDEARVKARSGSSVDSDFDMNINAVLPPTDDSGKYSTDDSPRVDDATVLGFVQRGQLVSDQPIPSGEVVGLLLDRSVFYGEQGGQVGDRGAIRGADAVFEVQDTKRFGDAVLHIGSLPAVGGSSASTGIAVGDRVSAEVDGTYRGPIRRNHTATHLLNWALREVLGDEIQQKGSLVDAEKTRFDFSHGRPVTTEELSVIESKVTAQIASAHTVFAEDAAQEEARKINTLRAVFGEKYPDRVRVVSIGANVDSLLAEPDGEWMPYSVEFCGGTHTKTTEEIEAFSLLSEEGVAKGVRRLVGVTGSVAQSASEAGAELLTKLATVTSLPDEKLKEEVGLLQEALAGRPVPAAIRQRVQAEISGFQKRIRKAEKAAASSSGDAVQTSVEALYAAAKDVAGFTVVAGEVPFAPTDALRVGADWVRDKTSKAVVLLACSEGGKVTLLSAVGKDAVAAGLKAGDLIKEMAPHVGGRGGGRPDMAQGGGSDPSGIAALVNAVPGWVSSQLG